MLFKVQPIQTDQRIYGAELDELLQILSEIPNTINTVLLVGHNPDLEELLEYFVPDIQIPSDNKLIPTATLVHLQFDQTWELITDINNLLSYKIVRPRNLPKLK